MIMDFRLLVGDARLSTDSPSDQIHLIKMFMTCLNPQLKKKIIFRDIVPKTIEDWYVKAIQYDSNYWFTQALMALDNQTSKKNTGKSWFNQNQNQKDPNTMDIGATTTTGTAFIGALTEEMRTVLMKIGACFWCRKTGHLSCNCPLKHQEHDGWTEKGIDGDVDCRLGFLKKEPVSTTVTPSISILNVIVAEIENKSMTIPILLLCKQSRNKNVETKALLDTGAGGKFIDQNFVLQNNLRTHKLAKPITVYNVDGTENKTGTITWYVNVNLQIGNRTTAM